jgi:DNA-binding beta-propeller fold protein YncE
VSPGAGTVAVAAGGQELGYLSQFSTRDVDVTQTVALPSCGSNTCDAYILGRYTAAYSPTYYRVGVIEGSSGDILIRAQRADGTRLGNDIDTHIPAANGAAVMLHVEFVGANPTTLRARAWLPGTTEPSSWQLNTTDSDPAEQQAGMVGVRFRNEDTSAGHTFKLESYQVTASATPATVPSNPTGSAHLLYVLDDPTSVSSPGNLSVYDIDNNHAFLGQIPIPEASKRGLAMAPNRGLLYISDCGANTCVNTGQLIAYDLVHNAVAWIANYNFGVDQMAVTPDGQTIYMPHGLDATDLTSSILDASDGKPIGSFQTSQNGHNYVASLDNTQIYMAAHNYDYVNILSTATNTVTLQAGPAANGVAPFTINGKHTLIFTTSTYTCGFQVMSATTGSVLYTVGFSGACSWPTGDPSHGISLSPDEKRVYVMDAPLDQLEVYDVSGLPSTAPTFVASVPLSSVTGNEVPCQTRCQKEGWVLNDLSGRYVYIGDSGDVVSTSTLSIVANLPSLSNARQMIEGDWAGGVPSATSTHFGLGRVTS